MKHHLQQLAVASVLFGACMIAAITADGGERPTEYRKVVPKKALPQTATDKPAPHSGSPAVETPRTKNEKRRPSGISGRGGKKQQRNVSLQGGFDFDFNGQVGAVDEFYGNADLNREEPAASEGSPPAARDRGRGQNAARAPAPKPAPYLFYRVRRGQNLGAIVSSLRAAGLQVTVDDLRRHNAIDDPNLIQSGTMLRIPLKARRSRTVDAEGVSLK